MSADRMARTVLGVLAALLGACLLAGGAGLGWAQLTQRDDDGFYTSPRYTLTSDAHAVVLTDVDLDLGPWWARAGGPVGRLASVHVTATGDRPVFVGIARRSDLATYLAGVAHDRVADVGGGTIDTRPVAGTAAPAPPGMRDFWVASTGGPGTQEITWLIQDGRWAVVVMNADATAGVDVVTSAGARIEYLTAVALVLLAAGALCLLGAAAAFSTERPPVPSAPDRRYPLAIEAVPDATPGRWLWTVKWLLVVPHVVVLAVLWSAFMVSTVVAGLAVLVTGRYPRVLFDFATGVLRWTWRVGAYSYLALGTDRYPPFTLRPTGHPATLELEYPARLSRGLVLFRWLLAVPHLLVVGIVVGAGTVFGSTGAPAIPLYTGGLIGLLVLIAGGHLLLLGRYPRGLFDLLVGLNRWVFRVIAYLAFLTDVYPPFRLDTGGTEPEPDPVRHSTVPTTGQVTSDVG